MELSEQNGCWNCRFSGGVLTLGPMGMALGMGCAARGLLDVSTVNLCDLWEPREEPRQ